MRLEEFEKVDLEDMDMFRRQYERYPLEHSDYMHSDMMSWSHYMDYLYAWMDDCIILITVLEGVKRIRPPIGEFSREKFLKVMEMTGLKGLEPVLSMIGQRTYDWMSEEFSELEYTPHRDYFEYVYSSSDLADLPGKRYLKIRNYLNKFRRENHYQVEPIDGGNKEEVKDFLRRWCMMKGCKEEPFLLSERQANMYSLEHMEELGVSGIAIRIGDRIEALSLFEKMTDDTAVVHFEKANFEILGSYQVINNETAMILKDRYKFINREADMGVAGLRKAKEKYGPHHMLKVFHAKTNYSFSSE